MRIPGQASGPGRGKIIPVGYWKIGRVVEGTVLERRRARKGPKGSNPLSSATPLILISDRHPARCRSELSGYHLSMTPCMKTVATVPLMLGVTRAGPGFDQQHADVA